jgi:transcriptional regulator of arginine metabolism
MRLKLYRQKKIAELVRSRSIETQEDLATALRDAGFSVTQATVSRDIKDMGLIKVTGEKNSSYYVLPGRDVLRYSEDRMKRLFAGSVQSIDSSENLIIIKTLPGEAQGVASAIDHSGWPEIIGTVAGDDTIMVVVKPKSMTTMVQNRFNHLAGG